MELCGQKNAIFMYIYRIRCSSYILVILGMYLNDMVAEAVLTSLLVGGTEK